MKTVKTTLAIAILLFAGAAAAGSNSHGHKKHDLGPRQDLYEYARVVKVQPIYREVRVSNPVRECWDEPVYHTRNKPRHSAGGMLAGGVIGGIIGNQLGKGRNRRIATAVGAMIGAQIGHQADNQQVNNHGHDDDHEVAGYEQNCKTRHQVSYEEVLDGYDVTYKYRGKRYHVEMPYDPGKRIKMRIQFTPVI